MGISPQVAADARATLQQVAPGQTPAAYLLMLAHTWFESNWGRYGWLAGSNNWGAEQATAAWQKAHAGQAGYGVLPYTDTHNTGGSYAAGLKVFPSQALGAADYFGSVYSGFFGRSVPQDAQSFAAALHPHNTPNAQGVFVGNYYEGSGTDADTIIATYAGKITSNASLVSSALAAADAQGLVGNPNLQRPDAPPNKAPHVIQWLDGSGGGAGGGLGVVACLALVGLGLWAMRS